MRILVATDGSPCARRAADFAGRFARELRKAELVLVNVGNIPAIVLSGPDYGALEEGLEKAGQAILDRTEGLLRDIGVPITTQYRRGEPSQEVLAAAAEVKADLIVMGSRGLGQIGGLILGSVSEHVLHGARIPVLIVR